MTTVGVWTASALLISVPKVRSDPVPACVVGRRSAEAVCGDRARRQQQKSVATEKTTTATKTPMNSARDVPMGHAGSARLNVGWVRKFVPMVSGDSVMPHAPIQKPAATTPMTIVTASPTKDVTCVTMDKLDPVGTRSVQEKKRVLTAHGLDARRNSQATSSAMAKTTTAMDPSTKKPSEIAIMPAGPA